MKIMLMDTDRLVNLVLPTEVFGNYWVVNSEKENLVGVEGRDNNWVIKSNSEVKVFRSGQAVDEAILEPEKFYTLRDNMRSKSYVIYTCLVYDPNALQLNIYLNGNDTSASWYIGNNNANPDGNPMPNIVSDEQNGIARNQLKITIVNGQYSIVNLNPSIPMYINGLCTESTDLRYGDSIFILGFKLSIVKDIFYMNNLNKLVKFDANTFVQRQIPTLDYSNISNEPDPVIDMYKKEDYFLKPPRFDEKIEEKTLVIDPPPQAQKSRRRYI